MPRDSNGVYSLPTGYLAVSGEDILPEQHNAPLQDIATALTGSLPRNGSAAMTANFSMGGFKVTNAANATDAADLITKGQVDAAVAGAVMPAGAVVSYAGAAVPSGWLLCNGQAVSRTAYAALFAAVGTVHGTGDGSTTFNVPDLRGEFVRGLDAGRGVDAARTLGSAQAEDIKSHTHAATSTVTDPGHTHDIDTRGAITFGSAGALIEAFAAVGVSSAPASRTTLSRTTGITASTTITATGGTETRPRNVALNYIIKT